jgi:hypothetical protein
MSFFAGSLNLRAVRKRSPWKPITAKFSAQPAPYPALPTDRDVISRRCANARQRTPTPYGGRLETWTA